jgi:Uma2 family endonuclease
LRIDIATVTKIKISPATPYYALDKASDRRWEYWDGEIICMSGGSKEHAIIQGNVLKHLSNRLKEHCRAFSADMAVKTKTQAGYVYPDVSAGH